MGGVYVVAGFSPRPCRQLAVVAPCPEFEPLFQFRDREFLEQFRTIGDWFGILTIEFAVVLLHLFSPPFLLMCFLNP
jgi:hypothetical protein